jgi:hypothetical protein
MALEQDRLRVAVTPAYAPSGRTVLTGVPRWDLGRKSGVVESFIHVAIAIAL